jgi:ribosomal protein S27AE
MTLEEAVHQLSQQAWLKPMDKHWASHFAQHPQDKWGESFEFLIWERLGKFTKKSLKDAGIDLSTITPPAQPANLVAPKRPWNWRWTHIQTLRNEEAAKEPKTVTWNGQSFIMAFGYNRTIVDAVKGLPKWGRFDKDTKTWIIPAEPENGEPLKNIINSYGFDAERAVMLKLDSLEATPTETVEISGDDFLIRFGFNDRMVNSMRRVPKAKFDRMVKAWRVPKHQTALGFQRLRDFAQLYQFTVTPEAQRQMNADQMRFCPNCETEQPAALFHLNDYLCGRCRNA